MGSELSIQEDYCKALIDDESPDPDESQGPADLPKKKNIAIIQKDEIERDRQPKTFYD